MASESAKKDGADENAGAWIVHHGQKLQADQSGASEFSALDGAAKGGMLLAGMAASEQAELNHAEVVAIANNQLNPKTELQFALDALKKRQVIDVSANGAVSVLGISSRQVLRETAKLFEGLEPSQSRASSRRSSPQNNSSPTVKLGAPNRPRIAASSTFRRSRSLFSGDSARSTSPGEATNRPASDFKRRPIGYVTSVDKFS